MRLEIMVVLSIAQYLFWEKKANSFIMGWMVFVEKTEKSSSNLRPKHWIHRRNWKKKSSPTLGDVSFGEQIFVTFIIIKCVRIGYSIIWGNFNLFLLKKYLTKVSDQDLFLYSNSNTVIFSTGKISTKVASHNHSDNCAHGYNQSSLYYRRECL